MFLKFGLFSIFCCIMLPKTSSWMFGNVVHVKSEDPVAEEIPSSGNLHNSKALITRPDSDKVVFNFSANHSLS